MLVLDFLRQQQRLTGTKEGGNDGNCGACTVLFDGSPVKSCTMFAVQTDGHEVTTVEGLSPAVQRKLLYETAARVYQLPKPQ